MFSSAKIRALNTRRIATLSYSSKQVINLEPVGHIFIFEYTVLVHEGIEVCMDMTEKFCEFCRNRESSVKCSSADCVTHE